MVWELLLIFMDSVAHKLVEAIRVTDLGEAVNDGLALPEHLRPQTPCFLVNCSRHCFVSAWVKSSPLLEGVLKREKAA